jgi:hypothetical protein
VSLTIIAESLTAQTYGFSFQSDADGKIVQCGITDVALADLVDFHHVKSAAADAPPVLLPEIERLANTKYEAGRLEEDGGLLIRSTDLVRYGFGGKSRRRDGVTELSRIFKIGLPRPSPLGISAGIRISCRCAGAER